MRVAEIEIGATYRIREWQKSVRGCEVYNLAGHCRRITPSFPAFWLYWNVTIVEKVRRRYVVEWTEPHPLHEIPDTKMRWTTRTRRTTVTPSQVMERVSE